MTRVPARHPLSAHWVPGAYAPSPGRARVIDRGKWVRHEPAPAIAAAGGRSPGAGTERPAGGLVFPERSEGRGYFAQVFYIENWEMGSKKDAEGPNFGREPPPQAVPAAPLVQAVIFSH